MPERFTPGPWKVGSSRYTVIAPADNSTVIAAVAELKNVQLITQAPALYALVKELIKTHSYPCECNCFECVAARRIIAQVESEERK